MYSLTEGFSRYYTDDPMLLLIASGNPFKCHEEVLFLHPMIPPKRWARLFTAHVCFCRITTQRRTRRKPRETTTQRPSPFVPFLVLFGSPGRPPTFGSPRRFCFLGSKQQDTNTRNSRRTVHSRGNSRSQQENRPYKAARRGLCHGFQASKRARQACAKPPL